MPSKDRAVITISPELRERLLAFTRATGIPYSVAFREGVTEYLDRRELTCAACGKRCWPDGYGPKGPLCADCF